MTTHTSGAADMPEALREVQIIQSWCEARCLPPPSAGDCVSLAAALAAGQAVAPVTATEIESLNAQLHAAKQINAAQFWLITSSIPGSALRASHWQAPAEATSPWSRALEIRIAQG